MKGRAGKPIALEVVAEKKAGVPMDSEGGVATCKKHGGKVGGEKARHRADKMSRGGGSKKWIQKAHLKKGAFTAQAEKAGKSVHEYAEEKKDAPGKTGKRAHLALLFQKMAHKG